MRNRIDRLSARALPLVTAAIAALVMASTATLVAGTTTNGGITLTWPNYSMSNPLFHCEPQNDPTAEKITVSGVPLGSMIMVNFTFSGGPGTPLTQINQTFTNQDGTVSYSIPYPPDSSTWPYFDGETRQIFVAAFVAVFKKDGTVTKLASSQWKVICKPDVPDPPGGAQGCTPGYWRQIEPPNDQHLDSWTATGYAPGDLYETVFGVDAHLDPAGPNGEIMNPTLGQAIALGGGGENALARHAVAALLNAAHPGVNYPMTEAEVIATVVAAYASGDFESAHLLFEGLNEVKDENGQHLCPLN